MPDGPIKPQWFQILLALAQEELHGYGIQRAVLRQTDDAMTLWPAMLYRSLSALEESGWIEPIETPEGQPDDERRQYYAITSAGRSTLREEAERMERWVRVVRGSDPVR